MKFKLAALVLVTTAGLSSVASADDGKINFIGDIIESGCEVNSTLSSPMTVKLGTIAKTAFNATAGTTAANTKFTLVLKNCPNELKNVAVKYDGTPDQINEDALQVTDYGTTGVAKGVAIQLMNSSGSVLPLGTESDSTALNSTGDTNLDFFARYIATEDTIEVGSANGTVNFTLAYN